MGPFKRSSLRAAAIVTFALLMFAANSVLCRMALGRGTVDAASFSLMRLAAGAAVLLLISTLRHRNLAHRGGSWGSAFWLFLYAVPFSIAYRGLTTGTGALILFGVVQLTMLLGAWLGKERPDLQQWTGLALALAGLLYLVSPGLSAPNPASAALMALAGMSWGIYSLQGRRPGDPLLRTTGNFLRATPMAFGVLLLWPDLHITAEAALLAIISGALASAMGYVAWYSALRSLSATKASILQLSVPVLAALAGMVILAEPFTHELVTASILVIGGTAATMRTQRRSTVPEANADQ